MGVLKLTDVEWGEFETGQLFDKIIKGKCTNEASQTVKSDKGVSYLSATSRNNGISGVVEPNTLIQKGNCIMFVNQGDGGAGLCVYKREDFISTTSNSFGYAYWVNKYTGLFFATVSARLKEKYSFGYGRTQKRIMKDVVLLPIDSNGEPDWEYMENYIKQEQKPMIQNVVEYYEDKVLDVDIDVETLDAVEWSEFKIGGEEGIFEIKSTSSGIDKNKLNQDVGNIPYLTRTDVQNGVDMFVTDDQSKIYDMDQAGVITIGLDTQTVFYQSSEFFTGQNIQVLSNENLTERIALFFIPNLKIQMVKFNWGGNGATLTRLKRSTLLLPVDVNGRPDWEYMENYIKQKQSDLAKKIVKYYSV